MGVKQELLKLFENNVDVFLSGEEIADKLGCSRGAVWKAVKVLEAEGYNISASTNKGYRLSGETDVLSAEQISEFIGENSDDYNFCILKTIDSTNSEARRLASAKAKEWTIVIADEQTAGRGRLNRSFYSPSRTGLYMSIILQPKLAPQKSIKITTAAAVAVAEAIESVAGIKADIKWVNDIYYKKRKVCGILTEALFSMESNIMESAVLGIGVDLYAPENGYPKEIQSIAGCVLETRKWSTRNLLAAEIIKRFRNFYDKLDDGSYMDGYKKRLMYIGEKVLIISGDSSEPATVTGVDDDCRLLVRYDDGTEAALYSGEISIYKENLK